MKKTKKRLGKAADNNEQTNTLLASAIMERKFSDSHLITNHVIQDCILQDVAQKSWENELVGKFHKRYMVNWSKQYGSHMYYMKADDKIDDGRITPKKGGTQSSKSDQVMSSQDVSDRFKDKIREPRKSIKLDRAGIISINADKNVLAINLSTKTSVDGKEKGGVDQCKPSDQPSKDENNQQISQFTHYTQTKNPDTILI